MQPLNIKKITAANKDIEVIRFIVISNITIELYFTDYLKQLFRERSKEIDIVYIPYETAFDNDNYQTFQNADYIIVWLNFNCMYPDADIDIINSKTDQNNMVESTRTVCSNLYNEIKNFAKAPIIWLGFEDYYKKNNCFLGNIYSDTTIDKLNRYLLAQFIKEDTILDTKRIISQLGIEHSYNNKTKYRWNAPYSKQLIKYVADDIYKFYLNYNGITPKCIVLDCDNVLWGGILSEDGIENIKLGNIGKGREFRDFQKFLLELYYHGVILTICSKNDKKDVLKVLRTHSDMLLKERHFALIQANWSNKPHNIREIAEILNIDLGSIIFVDDSDFELQAVKTLLPTVKAIKYTRDTIYKELSCFNLKNDINIEKTEQRINTYRTNEKRYQLKSECTTFDEFIEALQLKIDIHESLVIEANRLAELTQRTNKCTIGIRYNVTNIMEIMKHNDYKLYTVNVSDKFSDLGIVGAIGINKTTLDLFSLSCRALGRGVETHMLDFIFSHNIKEFNFKPTSKNTDLYNKINSYLRIKDS